MKIHNLLYKLFAFFNLNMQTQVNSSQATDFVSWLAKHLHARAHRAILVNAQIERQFKTQSGYFGYCQTYLNTEKSLFCQYFFLQKQRITQVCAVVNLLVLKLLGLFHCFWLLFFVGLDFRALNAIKIAFRLVKMKCKKFIGFAKALLG